MSQTKKIFLKTVIASILTSFTPAEAAEIGYPELQMVPRYSTRLEKEAKAERDNKWTKFLPIQASAALTLFASLTYTGATDTIDGVVVTESKNGAALIVGAGWILGTVLFGYSPYENGWNDIKKMPAKTKREQLARERFAEMAINDAASAGRRLNWISFITNGAASGMMVGQHEGSSGVAFATIAAVGSILPIIIGTQWQSVANQQRKFKKRIFGPVGSATMLQDKTNGKYVPGYSLAFHF